MALGFFGLGTGDLIYGPQELLGYPKRDPQVDRANGIWGIWLPGFCQFLVGVYLFVGLWPLGLLFTGLTLVYVCEFFATFQLAVRGSINLGEKALGLSHILVGLWLMYLTFATTLNMASGFHLRD